MTNEDKIMEEELKEEPTETSEEAKEEPVDAGAEPEPEEEEGQGDKAEEEESNDAKYMRLMADFQNFKKRTEKEKQDIYSYANEKIIVQILDVFDNFERALGSECADESYAKGMEMIFKQLQDVLTKAGLEEIEALGQDFDPNFHNAVMTEDNPEFESGKVSGVLQKGYRLNNKVIRPTMVKVNN